VNGVGNVSGSIIKIYVQIVNGTGNTPHSQASLADILYLGNIFGNTHLGHKDSLMIRA